MSRARKNKITLSDRWKDGIQATMIMNRLCKHIEGELELTSTQIKAAQIVLSKVIPDLARTEHTGEDGGAIKTESVFAVDEWLAGIITRGQKASPEKVS